MPNGNEVTLEKSGGYISVDPREAIEHNQQIIDQIRQLVQEASAAATPPSQPQQPTNPQHPSPSTTPTNRR